MFRIITYLLITVTAAYALVFLLMKKYRTRAMVWLPLFSIGAAVALSAILMRPSVQPIVGVFGGLIGLTGIAVSRTARKPKPETPDTGV